VNRKILIPLVLLAVLAAGCSSSSSSGSASSSPSAKAPKIVSGTETITGNTTSSANKLTIQLVASGVVADTGHISLGGGSNAATGFLVLYKGKLAVFHSKSVTTGGQPNTKTCAATGTARGTYKVIGARSTGLYKGATGHGIYTVVFSGHLPRLKNGKCNLSRNAQFVKGTSLTTFTAKGQLTVM
jgi:hypothetical protein